jgi:two-component system phosphate regulon sensor histidine kinase PhoR
MDWWLPRTFTAVFAMLLGAFVGMLFGDSYRSTMVGTLLGGALAVGAAAVVDSLRGHRLMEWLRGSQAGQAPRDTGFWGELAYRFERTLRAREQAASREQRRLEQFLSAIEASPNGVLLLDASDQIDWCNRVAADHFGLDPERDRRQRVTNLVRQPAFVAYLQGDDFSRPVGFVGPSRVSLSVLVRPYGEGMKLVLSQDVTERERADAMRRDFVANVSHEIRTPLTVLAGFVETLSALSLTEPERQRVLALMAQQTDRMQALVADLLTLAQLEGSSRPTADRWQPVSRLLERARLDAVSLSSGRHDIVMTGGDDAEIAGAETELLSAVGNLLSNAVRYTPSGGHIALRFDWRPGGMAVIAVSDDGPGVAREHLPRLTERFYRVDGSRSRETGGTGLGLAIVKHVVQRHGGDIEVDSEVGRGSEFRLVFPAARLRVRSTAEAGADA